MNYCSLSPLFGVLGKKWAMHLMATFGEKEVISFGDLRREFPQLTSSTLTARLSDFQNFDLIEKTQEGKYTITQTFRKLTPLIRQLDLGKK